MSLSKFVCLFVYRMSHSMPSKFALPTNKAHGTHHPTHPHSMIIMEPNYFKVRK